MIVDFNGRNMSLPRESAAESIPQALCVLEGFFYRRNGSKWKVVVFDDLILCWSTVNCRPSLADLWEGHWLILLSRSKGRDRVNELGVVWRVADR